MAMSRVTRRIVHSAVALAVASYCHSCARDEHAASPLMGGLQSGMTPTAVQDLLQAGDRWRKFDEWSKHRPVGKEIRVLRVAVDPFVDLNVEGRLEMWFVNGQLMSTAFTPRDWSGYLRALAQERQLTPEAGDIQRGSTRVFVGGDKTVGERFVRWEDVILADKYHRYAD